MKSIRSWSLCLLAVGSILGASAAITSRADAKSNEVLVIVRLIDGSTVEGSLLSITKHAVKVDPSGPATLRVLAAAEIAAVEVPARQRTIAYPLADERELRRLPSPRSHATAPVSTPVFRDGDGFGMWMLGVGGTAAQASGSEEGSYYQGFGSGKGFHTGIRFLIPQGDRRRSRPFVALGYTRSTLSAEIGEISGYDDRGNPLSIRFDDLLVHRYSLEVGVTTPRIGRASFFYALMGLTMLKNEASAVAKLTSTDGSTVTETVEVTDSRGGLRFGAGLNVGTWRHWGLEFGAVGDLLLGAPEEVPGHYGQKVPSFQGAVLGVTASLTREF